ncbi:hypothetical protein Tco_0455948 [Tanacetum coccineum]
MEREGGLSPRISPLAQLTNVNIDAGWRINRRNCYIVAYWTTIFGDDKMSLGEVYELGFIETNSKGQDTQDMAGTSSYSRRPQVKHSSAQKRSADPRTEPWGVPGPPWNFAA